ncbi:hypothetical protein J3R30DRAFT_3464994 [Lentinula aciculospora]|uniref:Uncharacterized protein n=1 Tax=Lentinula aciculospora TaxID=153920 RepID=A0A9W9DQ71_9AGAR|nr:hypothetical protein J3R30DRAFT_3464994 [Lentinula aciculospora]
MDHSLTTIRAQSTSNPATNTPLNRPPLSAQESREKRLAHQQSRFRDRGGVFVPQQRTALLDILLGKTTLKHATARRSRSRSTSHSPVRRISGKGIAGGHVEPPVLSRTRKGRKSAVEVVDDDEESLAGPSRPKNVAVARKPKKKASATKKSTAKKSVPDPIADFEFADDKSIIPSNVRTSRKSSAGAKTIPPTNRKGKEKATQDQEEPNATGKNGTKAKAAKSKAPAAEEPKKNDRRATQTGSKATKTTRKAALSSTISSGNVQDHDVDDTTSDYPSSPLARRGKRRAATKSKIYVEDETDHEEEDSHPQRKTSKAKAKPTSSKPSKKPAKQKQQSDQKPVEVETAKQQGRSALTPVPEESEPESEAEHGTLADCLAQDLAAAISKTVQNFAPVSRVNLTIDKHNDKDSTVGTQTEKGKTAAPSKVKGKSRVVKGTIVSGEAEISRKDEKISTQTKQKSKGHVVDREDDAGNAKATRGGKGRGRMKTNITDNTNLDAPDLQVAEVSVSSSPPRPLKRARPAVEPGSVNDATSSRKRKKPKTVEESTVDISTVTSTARSRKNKDKIQHSQSQRDDVATRVTEKSDCTSGDNALQIIQNKRKRATVIAQADDHEAVDEPEPKSKKKKEGTDARKATRGLDVNSELHSPPKPRLKTASRKQKENSAASVAAPSAKFADTSGLLTKKVTKSQSRKQVITTSKETAKRGPPQSVLDRIKKSALVNGVHDVDDEPDELNLLS